MYLVTGGSRGIGKSTVLDLVKLGKLVVFTYNHNLEKAKEVLNEAEQLKGTAIAIKVDFSEEDEIMALFNELDKYKQPLIGVVNNVGIVKKQSSILDISLDRLKDIYNINVFANFLCLREACRRMSTSLGGAGGSIVNVSSRASVLGSPNEYVDYASTKGAIDTMTIGTAKEFAEQGIRINAVRPGLIKTDMHADSGEPERVKRLEQTIPLKRGGSVREVAEAICWLLSEKSAYVTGTFIDVSGGR